MQTTGCLGRFKPDLEEYGNILVEHIQIIEKALFGITAMDAKRSGKDWLH